MAKVGIITMNQVINYGSTLQTYATHVVIERLGHTCIIIDYCYPNEFHCHHGAYNPRLSLKSKISKWLRIKAGWKKRHLLLKFLQTHTTHSQLYKSPEELKQNYPDCDIFVSGSDQIWNPRFNFEDNTYLLDFVPSGKRKISFSSSFSTLDIPTHRFNDYKKWLSLYDAISVREQNGVGLIKKLTGKNAELILDPTLILDADYWHHFADESKKSIINEPYILVYILKYAINPKYHVDNVLRQYGGVKIVLLENEGNLHTYDKKIDVCSSMEFVKLIRNASMVITSSFHGCAFALNFGKPLIAFYDDSHGDDRISSLLRILGLEHCGYNISANNHDLNPYYDISKEQAKLQKLREKSICFLKRNLS